MALVLTGTGNHVWVDQEKLNFWAKRGCIKAVLAYISREDLCAAL